MNKPKFALAASLLAAAFFATGCGGGEDSSDEPAPTKSAYITEGDAICTASQTEFEAIVKDLPNDVEAPGSQAAITDGVVPLYWDQVGQLRASPSFFFNDTATTEIYDSVDQALDTIEVDPSALDDAGTFEEANTLAVDYGFEACGN